jgi:phosphohistidine phosphatase SixA
MHQPLAAGGSCDLGSSHSLGRYGRQGRMFLAIAFLGLSAASAVAQTPAEMERFKSLSIPAPAAARSSKPANSLSPSELVRELRKGGYVLFFRHAATELSQDDSRARSLTDCSNQRSLNAQGRDEARAIGRAFAELRIPIGRVLASPVCRADETATLIFGRNQHSNALIGDPDFRSSDPRRYFALKNLFLAPVPAGANLGLVGHGNPFGAVAGLPQIAEGEMAMIRPLENDFEVVARVRPEAWPGIASAAKAK